MPQSLKAHIFSVLFTAVGAVVGWFIGNGGVIWCAGLGFWLGSFLDEKANPHEYLVTILVSASLADKPVQPGELKRIMQILQDSRPKPSEAKAKKLIQWKLSGCETPEVLGQLMARDLTTRQSGLKFLHFMPKVLSVIYSDGDMNQSEAKWIERFCTTSNLYPEMWPILSLYFERLPEDDSDRSRWCKVLDVPSNADAQTIKAAYRKQMVEFHPDKLPNVSAAIRQLAEEKSKELNLAYQALSQTSDKGSQGSLGDLWVCVQGKDRQPMKDRAAGDVCECHLCSQRNRLPEKDKMHLAKCGACHAFLAVPGDLLKFMASPVD